MANHEQKATKNHRKHLRACLDNPRNRITLIKSGISELEIGRAYQTLHGRIVT